MACRRLIPGVVALLSLAPAAGARNALAAPPVSGSATARIQVSATVAVRAAITVLYQQTILQVTMEDVSRGSVDVPAASRIEVRENSLRGYLLVFEEAGASDAPVERVSVRGLGSEIEMGRGGGFVSRPHVAGPVAAELGYRFTLSPDAQPGIYRWPFVLSARPL